MRWVIEKLAMLSQPFLRVGDLRLLWFVGFCSHGRVVLLIEGVEPLYLPVLWGLFLVFLSLVIVIRDLSNSLILTGTNFQYSTLPPELKQHLGLLSQQYLFSGH